MSVLFTKDGSRFYSYDSRLKEIASSSYVRGDIVSVDNGVLFTKDGSRFYAYDSKLKEIASSSYVRGDVVR